MKSPKINSPNNFEERLSDHLGQVHDVPCTCALKEKQVSVSSHQLVITEHKSLKLLTQTKAHGEKQKHPLSVGKMQHYLATFNM